jgi:hypothetical protein
MTSRARSLFDQLTAEPDPERVAALTAIFKRCQNAVNDRTEAVEPVLALAQQETGRAWHADNFFELWGWTSPEEMAEDHAIAVPPVTDLSEAELGELLALHGDFFPDRSLRFLGASLGEAFNTDLIFYPYREMSAEDLAKEVFTRRDILRSGGGAALRAYERELAEQVMAQADAKTWAQQWASLVLQRD